MTQFLVDYVERKGAKLRDGEKMPWFSSMLRFRVRNDETLVEGLELLNDTFVENVDSVLSAWKSQLSTCDELESAFTPSALADRCVASDAFLAGAGLREAVRYPYLAPNSGWYFFDVNFAGDERTLQKVHIGDVLLVRPDLLPFLALKPGFCVDLRRTDVPAWFEDEVAGRAAV